MSLNIFGTVLLVSISYCQGMRWMWYLGNDHANQMSADAPMGPRSGSGTWQEGVYNIWFFGGEEFDTKTNQKVLKSDLWQFNGSNKWKLVHPGSTSSDISSTNENRAPTPRRLASVCGVLNNMIVVYGGFDKDSNALGDTWVYYIPESKWLTLSEMYKKMKNETLDELPGVRADAATWCLTDRMYVFSGWEGGVNANYKLRTDFWKFDLLDLTWERATGSYNHDILINAIKPMPLGRSGAVTWNGLDNELNNNRHNKRLYLFGGNMHNKNPTLSHVNSGYSTDFWMFDIDTQEWEFIMGKQGACLPGSYGKFFHPNKKNFPGCRRGAVSWTDTEGNLWMLGGDGATEDKSSISAEQPSKILNDLWYYDLELKVWYWMGGSKEADNKGKYKSLKSRYIEKTIYPSARTEAVGFRRWNELLLLGGIGYDSEGNFGHLNDAWGIDVHSEVVYRNTAYPSTVFMLLFVSFGLLITVVVTFTYLRKFYRKTSMSNGTRKFDAAYAPLTVDGDD